MDFGGIASLIGAGSSLASNLFGMFGGGGDEEQQDHSAEILKMMQAGIDDGNGNKVIYDPKTNTFKTILNPVNKQAAGASDMETLMRLLTEMPRERQERYENSMGRSGDRQLANTLRNRITNADANRMTPERLEGDLYSANSRGINEAYDKVAGDVATTGLRTHQSSDSAITNLAKTLAKSLGDARVDARLGSYTGADQINSGHVGELMNEYGAENASANNVDSIPFNPFTLNTQMAGLASSQKAGIPQAAYSASLIGSKANDSMQDNIFDFGQNLAQLLGSFKSPSVTTPLSMGGSTGLGNTNYGIPQAQRAGF